MLNKIRAFKELKRRETFLSHYQNCASCGSPIRFAHASNYLANSIVESCSCPSCGQSSQERRYTLN
jgi:transcription elongation factor Elf1